MSDVRRVFRIQLRIRYCSYLSADTPVQFYEIVLCHSLFQSCYVTARLSLYIGIDILRLLPIQITMSSSSSPTRAELVSPLRPQTPSHLLGHPGRL
jgi:hypothetical protein